MSRSVKVLLYVADRTLDSMMHAFDMFQSHKVLVSSQYDAVMTIDDDTDIIQGLYTAINKIFLTEEFPDVEFVNREDDLGIEGLRKAKLSYKPIKLVDKYSLVEK